MQITSKTTDQDLRSLSRVQLEELMSSTLGYSSATISQFTKADMRADLLKHSEVLRIAEEREAAQKEEIRLAQLEKENQAGMVKQELQVCRDTMLAWITPDKEWVTKKLSETTSIGKLAHLIVWSGEEVLYKVQLISYIENLQYFFERELETPSMTAKEILACLDRSAEDYLNRCLQSDHLFNCTSVMTNINNMAELYAKQTMAKVSQKIAKVFKQFTECGVPHASLDVYILRCL